MYTGVSLPSSGSSSVAVVVCLSLVGGTGSYSPGFISRSGREPVSDSSVSTWLMHLVASL